MARFICLAGSHPADTCICIFRKPQMGK